MTNRRKRAAQANERSTLAVVLHHNLRTNADMPGTLRLTSLLFQAGSQPGSPSLEIVPSTVVVLIGPNNAGKSLALREIEMWCIGENRDRRVVDSVSVDFPAGYEEALALIRPFIEVASGEQLIVDGQFTLMSPTFQADPPVRKDRISAEYIQRALDNKDVGLLRRYLTQWNTVRLDGRTRFELTDQRPVGDLLRPPEHHLAALVQNDDARFRVRELTAAAFGSHFVLDLLNAGQVRIRFSPRPPEDPDEELALSPRAQAFHRQATPIEDMSDGVKAFTGLVSAAQSLPHRILLVDEPEAFLHPPLARRLGSALARLAQDRGTSLVAATHSAEFLFGCLESVADTSVVRLDYDPESGAATAKALSSTELANLARDPLMRSTDVLRALFHRAAVVTESDADRAFYDEMNRRLNQERRGIVDALFLNAQNKDTVDRLVGPLRRIGIPAAAIVDLDVIKDGSRSSWNRLLAACNVSVDRRIHLATERSHLANTFGGMVITSGQEAIKRGGIEHLQPADRARAEALFGELAEYGLFLVPIGELEAWLSDLNVEGHAPKWLVEVFARIGASDDDPNYVRPGDDNVWAFLDDISRWVSNPHRRGME
jgi:hypothetical protein